MKGQDNVAVQVKAVEAKKPAQVSTTNIHDKETLSASSVVEFVGDVKTELKKVTWTSPEELKVYTQLVVAMTFFLGMAIYFLDLIIHGALSVLNGIMYWIA